MIPPESIDDFEREAALYDLEAVIAKILKHLIIKGLLNRANELIVKHTRYNMVSGTLDPYVIYRRLVLALEDVSATQGEEEAYVVNMLKDIGKVIQNLQIASRHHIHPIQVIDPRIADECRLEPPAAALPFIGADPETNDALFRLYTVGKYL